MLGVGEELRQLLTLRKTFVHRRFQRLGEEVRAFFPVDDVAVVVEVEEGTDDDAVGTREQQAVGSGAAEVAEGVVADVGMLTVVVGVVVVVLVGIAEGVVDGLQLTGKDDGTVHQGHA